MSHKNIKKNFASSKRLCPHCYGQCQNYGIDMFFSFSIFLNIIIFSPIYAKTSCSLPHFDACKNIKENRLNETHGPIIESFFFNSNQLENSPFWVSTLTFDRRPMQCKQKQVWWKKKLWPSLQFAKEGKKVCPDEISSQFMLGLHHL